MGRTESLAYPGAARRGLWLALLTTLLVIASCSVYPNPHADLVLHVANADAERQVLHVIRQFVQDRSLVASSALSDAPVPETVRRLNERTTYYGSGTRYGEGRALTFLDASPTCKVLRVVERSREWNDASQADLAELRAKFASIPGVTVEEGPRFVPQVSPGRGIDEYCAIPGVLPGSTGS